MNREETKKAIEVMQAYVDGAEAEYRSRSHSGPWTSACPVWDWHCFEYRIKPTPRTFYAVQYGSSVASIGSPFTTREEAEVFFRSGRGKAIIELVEVIR